MEAKLLNAALRHDKPVFGMCRDIQLINAALGGPMLDAPQYDSVYFEGRFGLLVDAEWAVRKSNHLLWFIRNAVFSIPGASVEDVEQLPDRGMNRERILRPASYAYIQEAYNVILLRATGGGKTYLDCALDNAACREFYTVRYIHLPDLQVKIFLTGQVAPWRAVKAHWRRGGCSRYPPQ